jgi:hypothetical protein
VPRLEHRGRAAVDPELEPVPGAVRVRVGQELLEGHHAVPQPRREALPVGLEQLDGLLDVDQVELGRHDFRGLVQPADDDLEPLG